MGKLLTTYFVRIEMYKQLKSTHRYSFPLCMASLCCHQIRLMRSVKKVFGEAHRKHATFYLPQFYNQGRGRLINSFCFCFSKTGSYVHEACQNSLCSLEASQMLGLQAGLGTRVCFIRWSLSRPLIHSYLFLSLKTDTREIPFGISGDDGLGIYFRGRVLA